MRGRETGVFGLLLAQDGRPADRATVAAPMPTAFVTGGSGFIGGALVRRLLADGVGVRALVRSDASARAVRDAGAQPVPGDPVAMALGADGCDVAIHCAARVGDWGPREEFEAVNVGGTRRAIDACARAGVRRFVHVGTEAALRAGEPLVHADERVPLRFDPPVPYCATKAGAEEAAWRALPLRGRPPLTRVAVWLSGLQATINISGARTELGHAPVRTVDEGLAELAAEEGRGEQR